MKSPVRVSQVLTLLAVAFLLACAGDQSRLPGFLPEIISLTEYAGVGVRKARVLLEKGLFCW